MEKLIEISKNLSDTFNGFWYLAGEYFFKIAGAAILIIIG
jgi:hypothetical protein